MKTVRPLWLLMLLSMPIPSRASAEPSTEERIRVAKQEGAEEARKDLAAGNPKQYRSSGIVGRVYRYDWDPDSGLQIVDTGCFHSPAFDEYNRIVKEWIATHGLPSGSRKPRFVTVDIARKTLRSGSSLSRGGEVTGPEGQVIRWNERSMLSSLGADQVVAESNGKEIWSHSITGTKPIRVAWNGQSLFVEFSPGQAGDQGSVWHVDTDGDGVLQTFDLTAQ